MGIDLRCGDWREVLADVECDALITDPPYGKKIHDGHQRVLVGSGSERKVLDGCDRQLLAYDHWSASDVAEFVESWSPRVRGWFVALTSHDLIGAWQASLEACGRYVFHPIPCVIRGMTVRLCGDGPSSWAVYAIVARPKNLKYSKWGTLPGAYTGGTERGGQSDNASQITGGKPLWLMCDLVDHYSRKGDLVCDPCAGAGTTLRAAEMLERRAVGAEVDPETWALATSRLARPAQIGMFA